MGKITDNNREAIVAQEFAKVLRVSGHNDSYIENEEYDL